MIISAFIGWVIAGAVAGAVVVSLIDKFWNDIASWLNNTAADAVEKKLGYNARKFMQKAVARITKIHDKLHNTAVVYTKEDEMDIHIRRVTLTSNANVRTQATEVQDMFEKNSEQVQTFEYKN